MVQFDQDFENGSLGQVTRLGPDWYHVGLRPDTWYWTHFRVRGCRGREITFALTYLPHPHSNRWGVNETGNPEDPDYGCRSPYVSYDRTYWMHVDSAEKIASMPNTVQFTHRFEENEAYLCYTIPYTYSDLLSYLETIQDHPLIAVEMIGKTREGRDIPMVSVADDGAEKETIMIISREDGDEPTSNVALEGMIGRLTAGDDAIRAMLERTRFRIVPMVAVDSVVGGSPYGGRYYMAREWFRDPPLPEIKAVKDVVADCFRNSTVRLMGKLHGGQTYDNRPIWDFRVFDLRLRKLIPKTTPRPLDPVWNCVLRDAVPWVRKLTIFESFLQQTYDFWPFFSTHTNGRDPENLRAGGVRFADLLARYVQQ